MTNVSDCAECQRIIGELRDAAGEVEKLMDEMRANPDTVQRWLVEEDGIGRWLEEESGAQGAPKQFPFGDSFVSSFDHPRCPAFARAFHKAHDHYIRTGHPVIVAVRQILKPLM